MQNRALVLQKQPVEESTPGLVLLPGKQRFSQTENFCISISDLSRYIDDWVGEAQYLQQSPATVIGKRDAMDKLLWFLKAYQQEVFGTREIKKFLTHISYGHEKAGGRFGNPRLKNPPSARTVNYYLNLVQGLCRWLVAEQLAPYDLTAGLNAPDPDEHEIQPFSEDQLGALFLAAKKSSAPKRNEAILLLMLDTGLRASEVCSLRFKDLELHSSYGQATVVGKGRKKRSVPFQRRCSRALWQYLRETVVLHEGPLFFSEGGNTRGLPLTRSGLLQLFERLGQRAGITNVRCSPHTMRHTFAVSFLRGGGNTFTLQKLLGHSNLQMTQKYVAFAQADINAQHRQFSPADRLKG